MTVAFQDLVRTAHADAWEVHGRLRAGAAALHGIDL
jgi:hypothetical protein